MAILRRIQEIKLRQYTADEYKQFTAFRNKYEAASKVVESHCDLEAGVLWVKVLIGECEDLTGD